MPRKGGVGSGRPSVAAHPALSLSEYIAGRPNVNVKVSLAHPSRDMSWSPRKKPPPEKTPEAIRKERPDANYLHSAQGAGPSANMY
jgi:hypothetical protein